MVTNNDGYLLASVPVAPMNSHEATNTYKVSGIALGGGEAQRRCQPQVGSTLIEVNVTGGVEAWRLWTPGSL